jgi:hypothetical protein
VQVECGILKRFPVKLPRSQAGFLLNIILKPTSVKDGLAVAEQGENAGIPRPSALHLHIVELNLTGVRWFYRPPKTSIFEAFNHLKLIIMTNLKKALNRKRFYAI